jgi:hypothetical protein
MDIEAQNSMPHSVRERALPGTARSYFLLLVAMTYSTSAAEYSILGIASSAL